MWVAGPAPVPVHQPEGFRITLPSGRSTTAGNWHVAKCQRRTERTKSASARNTLAR